MRFLKTTIFAALLLAPGAARAQSAAMAVGGPGSRAQVTAVVRFVVPEIFRVAETQSAQVSWQGDRYTEYLIKYTVASNSQWEFAADALPHGVTLLTWGGEWRDANASDLVVQRGAVSNGTEVLVRVRVADGASLNWRDELKFRTSGLQSRVAQIVAED